MRAARSRCSDAANGAAMMDAKAKLNFESASILLVDSSTHSLDVLAQILMGFGVRKSERAMDIDTAKERVRRSSLDLVVIDPAMKDGDGHGFIRWLRREAAEPNRSVPVIVVSSNGTLRSISRSRDAGANFFVTKPLTPQKLLDRVLWVIRDRRSFYESENYCGPDRRFKFEGPLPGRGPLRATDSKGDLGDAVEPNMSQSEIDSLLVPQKVQLLLMGACPSRNETWRKNCARLAALSSIG